MKTVWNKPATLRDVAKLAGVSRWVAGKVLNGGSGNTRARDETSNRIRRIAKELDYHPNPGSRLLRGERRTRLGCWCPRLAVRRVRF